MNELFLIKKIKSIVKKSQFYRNKIDKSLLENDSFTLIPYTTKHEILVDQDIYPPFGSNLCCDLTKVRRIHKTSGTTNKPVLIYLTQKDIDITLEIGAKSFKNSGLKSSDIVIHCLNYNMWSGGVTDHLCLENAGATVIPFGVGNTKNMIETMIQIKPTAIHCTPSYISKIEYILSEEFKKKPKELQLRLGLFGAESGMQNREYRKAMESKWGFKAMNANYGLSEVLSILASESEKQDGLIFTAVKYVYPEIIDLVSKKQNKIEKGATGELVLTNIFKESMPLIRYKTGDIIEVLDNEKFDDRNSFRFKIIGRTDDMFVIKGVNVFLSAIDNYISKFLDNLNGLYRVYINKDNPVDKMQIHVEYKNEIGLNIKSFEEKFIKGFKEIFQIQPELFLVKEGTLPRIEGKSKKLFREL